MKILKSMLIHSRLTICRNTKFVFSFALRKHSIVRTSKNSTMYISGSQPFPTHVLFSSAFHICVPLSSAFHICVRLSSAFHTCAPLSLTFHIYVHLSSAFHTCIPLSSAFHICAPRNNPNKLGAVNIYFC